MSKKVLEVLLVEDNKHDSRFLRRALARSDLTCKVTWVLRGEDALKLIEKQSFDVGLIDFNLPGWSGVETFQQMRAKGMTFPIIFVTGAGSEQVAVEALKLGAHDYLVKDAEQMYLDLLPIVLRKVLKQWEDKQARQRAEAELRQYAADLEAQNAELDAFAHTVAHDLKTPLSNIILFSQLLLEQDGMSEEEQQLYFPIILQQAEKMTDIIDALLKLAEVRQKEIETEPLEMMVLAFDAQKRVDTLIWKHNVQLVYPQSWPQALGYGPWIEEVWANYLSNAIKYGGEPPHIELGATVLPDKMVRFWVKDNGPGISEEDQARLFTPFTQLKHTNKGHGLGLSIVQRIIDKCGGQVGCESQIGLGSTFWFTLPAEKS